MLDHAQSSATPRRTLTEGTLAPSPTHPEADPRRLPEGLSRSTKSDEPLYSIRLAESPGTRCAACGKQETGAGPVGYLDDHPICDLCLLEADTDLGMALALIAVTRAYGSMEAGSSREHQDALEELGAFAHIYHRIASKSWPARIFRIPGFTAQDDSTH